MLFNFLIVTKSFSKIQAKNIILPQYLFLNFLCFQNL